MESTIHNSIHKKDSTTSYKSNKHNILPSCYMKATICDDGNLWSQIAFWSTKGHITKKEQLQVVSQLKRTCIQAWLLGAQTILNSSTSQVSWFWCPKMNRDVFFIHINEYRLFTHVNDMQMVDFQGVTAAIWSQVYHVWSHAKGVCVEMKEALWISALSSRTI